MLSKVLASRRARQSSLGGWCHVALRRIGGCREIRKSVDDQDTSSARSRCLLTRGRRRRASWSVPPPHLTHSRERFPRETPPAQVTHRSYGGAGPYPGRKTADLPENPGLPYQAARRLLIVYRWGVTRRGRSFAFPRDARRDARRFERVESPAGAEKRARFTG